MHLDEEPLSRWTLTRSTSVRDTEAAGAKLLSSHCLRLIDSSGFDAHINGLTVGGVSLYYMSYSTALAVAAPAMTGFIAVCIPLQGWFELRQGRARFEAVAGSGAAVVSPGEPFVMEWSPDLTMFCLRIDTHLLIDFVESVDVRPDCDVAFKKHVTCPLTLQSLLGCVRLAELAASQIGPGQRLPVPLTSRIRDQILLTLLLSQPNTLSAKLSTDDYRVGRAAVNKAIEFIQDQPTSSPSDVARDAGISLRALEVNFRDSLGLTPSAYILNTRLRGAREELRAAKPGGGLTIHALARRWGFSNFGRFALQYRQRYGERPSDTLKRACRQESALHPQYRHTASSGRSGETP